MSEHTRQDCDRWGWWLWICLGVGLGLRLVHLEGKPPWSDEWATLVFSLGNRLREVPLDRVISLETLLEPLQVNPSQGLHEVARVLFQDDTHPPLYFWLSHLWLRWFSPAGMVSLWAARSLSAILGAMAIPAMFCLGWLGLRSRLVGILAAALMACSPYGIYLAQEARHYTLAILWAIASLTCFLAVTRRLRSQRSSSGATILLWTGVNGLGMATHYFFGLTLLAEGLALLMLAGGVGWNKGWRKLLAPAWLQIYGAGLGTLAAGLVWLPLWQQFSGSQLTQWIYDEDLWGQFLEPLGRLVVWLITMMVLLPVEGVPLSVAVASGLGVLLALIWLLPALKRNWPAKRDDRHWHLASLADFVIGAWLVILWVTFAIAADLTIAARFQFFYFPAVLAIGAVLLARIWQEPVGDKPWWQAGGKRAVLVVLALSFLGGVTVVSDLGYQKFERPDLMARAALQFAPPGTRLLLATTHHSQGQTAEMMGVGWQFHQQNHEPAPHFLLAHKEDGSELGTQVLATALQRFPRPFQLGLLNFSAAIELNPFNCALMPEGEASVSGYRYRFYQCR